MLDLYEIFAPYFPIGEPPMRLMVVPRDSSGYHQIGPEPEARLVVQLANYQLEDERWQLMDIKEQELMLGWPVLFENRARVGEFLEGLRGAMARLHPEVVKTLMPHEVVRADVLKLKRARTRTDFEKALLTASRLGKYTVAPSSL